MGDNGLISVLMPVYKADPVFLKTAVESVLEQTYRNFELLILYEGDKRDKDYQYLEKISDDRLKIKVMPPKSGLPRSLNIGLAVAKGEYIARMDADDYSEKRRFEKQIHYMEKKQDVVVLGCICRIMDSWKFSFNDHISPETRGVRMLFGNAGIAHPTALIRKRFLDENEIRYNEEICGSEDYHLWVDITIAGGKIDTLKEVLLQYRLHAGQASERYKESMVEWDNMAKKKMLQWVGDFTEPEISVFLKFTICKNEEIDPEKSFKILKKIKSLPLSTLPLGCTMLQKEILYQWVKKGFYLYLQQKDKRMLRRVYVKGLWTRWGYWYLIKEFGRGRLGRIIVKVKYILKSKLWQADGNTVGRS